MNRRVATVFIDGLFLILLVLVLLPHEPEENEKLPGQVSIWINWPENSRADVDLWVQTPGDRPVGYSRLRGHVSSLLRDELGNSTPPPRQELNVTNSAIDGEYIVNVHLYKDRGAEVPIPVWVFVYIQTGSVNAKIWDGTVELQRVGEELTVVRFSIKDKKLVYDSIYYLQESLRNNR